MNRATTSPLTTMKLGNENLLAKHFELLKGKRVGILCHAASLDSQGRHIIDLLIGGEKDGGFKVTALFAPEHGLDGIAQDMEPVGHNPNFKQNPKSKFQNSKHDQIPVYSLYGETFASLSPTPEMLKDIDVLVVDLQDIGARYYTYVNTMALCMRVCFALKKEVVVCDRPNPINGVDAEGGIVEPELRSFVGMFPIPVRHAMTIGELAKFVQNTNPPSPPFIKGGTGGLHIVPMTGWNREHFWDETGLKWVNPSPNMRSISAALLYPGMCLLEATNISEGRGTRSPFETCGSPWIDGLELVKAMRALKLKGVDFDEAVFTPTARKFDGERCEGAQFMITDRRAFKPYKAGLALIHTIAMLYPKDFKWRREPYEFVSDIPAIDLLTGNRMFRKLVDKRKPLEEVLKGL